MHINKNIPNINNFKEDEKSKIVKRIIIDTSSFDTRLDKEKDNFCSPDINFSGKREKENLKKFDIFETIESEGGDSKKVKQKNPQKPTLKRNNSLVSKIDSKECLYVNEYKLKKNKDNVSEKNSTKNKAKSKFRTATTKGDNKDDNTKQKKNIDNNEFHLILIDADNTGNHSPIKSNYILDNYDYEEAIIYDKRSFFRIFFIYLISNDKILNIIFFNPPLELKPLRISVLLFSFACDFALNALFYLSDNISDKYHYTGSSLLLFTLVNNLTISLSSTIVTIILLSFFQALTQSTHKIESLFREQEILLKADRKYKVNEENKKIIDNKIKKILKCLKIKITFFLIFEPIFMIFFFYYVTSFCHVYKNTQISWILDCLLSYAISLIIEFVLSLISTVLYIIAIRNKSKILYKITIFLYSFV